VSPRRARSLVTALIAHGREAGTPATAAARMSVAAFLSEVGFTVQEQPFEFNGGIYRAMPAAGALLMLMSLLEVPLLLRYSPPWGALGAFLAGTTVASIAAASFLSGVAASPRTRRDANLIAQRPGAVVHCWLVAHLDTKAQGHSMAGRLVALWVTVMALVAMGAMAVLRLYGLLPVAAGVATGVLGVLAGLLLIGGRLAGETPGARDNGSGLLAVLTAAEVTSDTGIGIIITSAEEFGLAGARALVRERPALFAGTEVLNVDTIDDDGTLFVVTHSPGNLLAGRVQERLAGLAPVRGRRLPLGIMVDGVPLATVAAGAVTIGRLSWGTLRRMHSPRDDAAGYAMVTAELLGERLATAI